MHIQNDIIKIERSPRKKTRVSMLNSRGHCACPDGKLEEAKFILEDLAFRSPKDTNLLYNLGMVCSEFHEQDIATPSRAEYLPFTSFDPQDK